MKITDDDVKTRAQKEKLEEITNDATDKPKLPREGTMAVTAKVCGSGCRWVWGGCRCICDWCVTKILKLWFACWWVSNCVLSCSRWELGVLQML